MSDLGSFRTLDKYLSNMDKHRAWKVAFFLAMINGKNDLFLFAEMWRSEPLML